MALVPSSLCQMIVATLKQLMMSRDLWSELRPATSPPCSNHGGSAQHRLAPTPQGPSAGPARCCHRLLMRPMSHSSSSWPFDRRSCVHGRSGGEVLLLKRSSAHNDQKWGLPGGNVEEGDKDLIDTAKREATEEMGTLPPFDVKGEILTV